ncbi:GAF domain-containing protein [Massilia sp. CCM 9210]|uniref:GAF domain-containing protein n=1 Tax=Massilia scottii TaxID=3057166 RepID=UPI00279656CB|nr:GAF domain-containing protein [Massilia sp. CCM 9210]MDQ1815711.1 GAF domain-containing protein [Massilia sp. CCM 9210]
MRLQGSRQDGAAPRQAEKLAEEFVKPPTASYPMLETEQQRLSALSASGLIGSPPDPAFDRLTWLASHITGCPMAVVSLLTSERQWFKSRVGLDAAQTPRDAAFCSHTILSPEGMVVEDAWTDERFAANPLVLGDPHIRFYAGIPVTDRESNRLGTLCVLDSAPRQLTEDQHRGLKELAAIVTGEISRPK